MKKIICILMIGLFFVVACENKQVQNNIKTNTGMIHEHCKRLGKIDNNSSADLHYEVYYTGDRINRIESTESVSSTDSEVLDTYENAYRQIHAYYVDIDHYDTKIIRTADKVTSQMIIDYDQIDIAELVALEGEEDNIFEDNIPKMSKYRELAKNTGITCQVVS